MKKTIEVCYDHRHAGDLLDDTCYVCKCDRLTAELATLKQHYVEDTCRLENELAAAQTEKADAYRQRAEAMRKAAENSAVDTWSWEDAIKAI